MRTPRQIINCPLTPRGLFYAPQRKYLSPENEAPLFLLHSICHIYPRAVIICSGDAHEKALPVFRGNNDISLRLAAALQPGAFMYGGMEPYRGQRKPLCMGAFQALCHRLYFLDTYRAFLSETAAYAFCLCKAYRYACALHICPCTFHAALQLYALSRDPACHRRRSYQLRTACIISAVFIIIPGRSSQGAAYSFSRLHGIHASVPELLPSALGDILRFSQRRLRTYNKGQHRFCGTVLF